MTMEKQDVWHCQRSSQLMQLLFDMPAVLHELLCVIGKQRLEHLENGS